MFGLFIVLLVFIEGIVIIGFMSWELKFSEIWDFMWIYGYLFIVLKVVMDVIVIFVDRCNLLLGMIFE